MADRTPDAKDKADASPKKSPRSSSGTDDSAKPVFRTFGLDDAPDHLEYRSMAKTISGTAPPSLMGGRNMMMHGAGPSIQGLAGIPGPLAFASGKKSMLAPPPSFLKKSETTSASTTFGPRVDRTKYVGVIPRDLPPLPFRLELHTHFHVKLESIQRVCSVVGRKLCELDTDFVFKADKCKWKVDYRHNNGALRVNLNILIFKDNKEYVVEVQRRTGDITALMHLYGELKTFFKRNQLLCDKMTSSATGAKRSSPTSMPRIASLSLDNIRDAVSSVKGLIESKYVDTQMQGVLGAISLSTNEETRSGMATLVPQLVTLGQSKNTDLARLVGVALSRLCDHPECRQAFVQSEGWQFIVQCAAGGEDVNPEVQRESLHVVECLCPLYHDELANAQGADKVLQLIEGWQTIEDPRLKIHACNAERALKEAGVLA